MKRNFGWGIIFLCALWMGSGLGWAATPLSKEKGKKAVKAKGATAGGSVTSENDGPKPAAAKRGISIYFSGGLSAPLSPVGFNKGYTLGPNVGIGAGIDLDPKNSMVLDFNFDSTPMSQPLTLISLPGPTYSVWTGGEYTSFSFLLNGKFKWSNGHPIDPYFIGGAGVAGVVVGDLRSAVYSTVLKGISVGRFTYRAGLGADLNIKDLGAVFLEADAVEANDSYADFMKGLFKVGIKTDL